MNNTLWKTCRVLANQTRLNIIHRLYQGSKLCVQELALVEKITEPSASQHLKLLHEYGFLQQERKSKWVYYKTTEPRNDFHAAILNKSLRNEVIKSKLDHSRVIRTVTAFTHPRRIDIVKMLMNEPKKPEQLVWECDISSQALYRHVLKLVDRQIIEQKNNACRILRPSSAFITALLQCCEKEVFSHTS